MPLFTDEFQLLHDGQGLLLLFHLLLDKLLQEVLGGVVVLLNSQVHDLVDVLGNENFVLVSIFEGLQHGLPLFLGSLDSLKLHLSAHFVQALHEFLGMSQLLLVLRKKPMRRSFEVHSLKVLSHGQIQEGLKELFVHLLIDCFPDALLNYFFLLLEFFRPEPVNIAVGSYFFQILNIPINFRFGRFSWL